MTRNFQRFEAVVSSIEDPELRGRIKVLCPALMGDEITAMPVWCEPMHDWGWFTIPDVGETVEIEVAISGELDEVFGQSTFEDYTPRWRGKRFHTDAALEDSADGSIPSPIHDDFLADAYGKRRGFSTPWGHVLLFDDSEGAPRVYLTLQKDKLEPGAVPAETAYSRLEFEADGSLKVSLLGADTLHFKAADHTIELLLDGGASLKIEGKDADAVATLGDGAKSVAIAEALQTYIDSSLKAEFDAHTHPTGMGPSGPPAAPLTGYDSSITSSKLKIPDG
jgi:hypothetical protein